jgi:rubrerythrin
MKEDAIDIIFSDESFAEIKASNPKYTDKELLRAVHEALRSEEEAIQLYSQIIESTDNEMVIKTLQDILNEEQVHVGELIILLKRLDSSVVALLNKGETEVQDKDNLKRIENT